MTDQQYKGRSLLGLDITRPNIGGLAPNTLCRWGPYGALMRAQDSIVCGGARPVAEWSLGGAIDFAQGDGSADPNNAGGSQFYPDSELWRRVATLYANVTPGCELRALVLYVPSGLTQKQPAALWVSAGVWGKVRIGHIWTATPGGASTTIAYRSTTLEGSTLGTFGGGEPTQGGGWWQMARVKDIVDIRPANFLTTPATAAAYSEWSTVELRIEIQGGARLVHVCVYEHPLAHVQENDDAGEKSVHAMPESQAAQTPGPVTKAHDGVTWEEMRFGSLQLANVATRQSERLGPRIMHATSWRESDSNIYQQAEQNPITTASASFVGAFDSSITSYDRNNPGWIVGGANAKLHALCDPNLIMREGVAAVVPVRMRIDASRTAGTGVVRVQSSPHEWVDVSITGARAWYTMTGYLESQVFGDHSWAAVQIFIRCSGGGTLSLYNVAVDFGAWTL